MEKLKPDSQSKANATNSQAIPEKVVPKAPQAGPFAETAAYVREAVAAGKMTSEEGLRLSEQAYRDTMLAQLQGFPVETDSIQLPEKERKFFGKK